MKSLLSKIINSIHVYNIQPSRKYFIMLGPIVIMFFETIFLAYPETRSYAIWMHRENHPIELLTFLVFLIAGIKGLELSYKTKVAGEETFVYAFYIFFSIALLFIAMEEIAWGQWFLGFETPEAWKSINMQGETTLHNIGGLQGHSEIFRLIFGIGGLIGILFSYNSYFEKIGSSILLLPWFAIISLYAAIDVYNDWYPIQKMFDSYIHATAEMIELLIGLSAFLYIQLNFRKLGYV